MDRCNFTDLKKFLGTIGTYITILKFYRPYGALLKLIMVLMQLYNHISVLEIYTHLPFYNIIIHIKLNHNSS